METNLRVSAVLPHGDVDAAAAIPDDQDAPRPPSNVQKTRGVLRTRRDGRDRSISARRGVSVAVTGPIKRFEALAGVLSRFHAAPGAWRARAKNGQEDDEEREECSKLGARCANKNFKSAA